MVQRLAVWALRLGGWRLAGTAPQLGKYLVVLAPHTCNWDWVLGMLGAGGFGLRISWLGKSSIFRGPLGKVLRALGGIPVRRDQHEGIVGQVVRAYAATDALIVGMTPEGTRKRAPCWKSGFYHIARGAGVPIVPASIDHSARRLTLGPVLELSGNARRDMEVLRGFFANVGGIHPEKASPVRLQEEGALSGPA